MPWLFLNLLGFLVWRLQMFFHPSFKPFQERCINIKDCQKVYFILKLKQIVKVLSSHAFRSFMSLAAAVLVVAAASESDGGRSSSGMRRAAVITGMCCTSESLGGSLLSPVTGTTARMEKLILQTDHIQSLSWVCFDKYYETIIHTNTQLFTLFSFSVM